MKQALLLAIAGIVVLISYNYGLVVGTSRERSRTLHYRTLYYQSIQWQALSPVTHIIRDIRLKEKE